MKKFDQLLKDLGFRDSASKDAQRAFIRHLQRVAQTQTRSPDVDKKDHQLSFDPDILGSLRKAK